MNVFLLIDWGEVDFGECVAPDLLYGGVTPDAISTRRATVSCQRAHRCGPLMYSTIIPDRILIIFHEQTTENNNFAQPNDQSGSG
jgi:hypothetical protein